MGRIINPGIILLLMVNGIVQSPVSNKETQGRTTGIQYLNGPIFQETDVFNGGQDDINTYRIPSVICTKNGTSNAHHI